MTSLHSFPFQLEFRVYRRTFRRPLRTARGTWAVREGIIVRLTDSSGRVGYGEVAPVPSFTQETLVDDFAWLQKTGKKLASTANKNIPQKLSCLRWALSCAVEMIEGRLQPPAPARSLPAAALLPAGRAACAALARRSEQGYRVFKWKVAVEPAAAELGLLEILLAALPRGGKLRLDANGGLNRNEWKIWCAGMRALDRKNKAIEFFEQPLAKFSKIAAPVPVAWDESVASIAALRRIQVRSQSGPLIVKPSLLGDYADFLRWRAQAGADLVYSSAFETSIGLHAALCLAASDPHAGERALGFGTLDAFPADHLQLPEHAPAPTLKPAIIAPEKFLPIWNQLSVPK